MRRSSFEIETEMAFVPVLSERFLQIYANLRKSTVCLLARVARIFQRES